MRFRLTALAATLVLAAPSCGEEPVVEPPPPTTVGSARVLWTLVSTEGMPISCSEIFIDSAAVSIGRETKIVPCGDEMSVVFDGLIQSRYPVIIELRTLGSAGAFQSRGNVDVKGGEETIVTLPFEIDLNNALSGSALISWRIDDTPAAQGCAGVDGQTVRITELDGSIAEVDETAPCSAGMHSIAMMRPGAYGLRLELIDSTGSRVSVSSVGSVEVEAGETAHPMEVEFVTMIRERASLYASWTVNGSVSSTTACAAIDADSISIKAFPDNELIPTISATAACDVGSLLAGDIVAGSRPHRVVFQLVRGPPIPAVLTSTIVYDVLFRSGETSSVSADLRTM